MITLYHIWSLFSIFYALFIDFFSGLEPSPSCALAVVYKYDAWGNILNLTEGDENPFRYAGEYFDEETGFIYLRNRYYDPSEGRFTTEDPIQDGLNWYVYCGNNPVMFADPLGLRITCSISASADVRNLLEQITADDLKFVEFVDENGIGTGMGEFIIKETYDTDRHVGQKLIADLINSEQTININLGGIQVTNSDGTTSTETWCMYNATSTNPIQIYIDPNNTIVNTHGTYVQDSKGNIYSEDIPDYIHLGHELIHAWRDIKGLFIHNRLELAAIPYDAPQKLWREEEVQTMGINYSIRGIQVRNYSAYNGIISENGLRLENGLNQRVSYWYAY